MKKSAFLVIFNATIGGQNAQCEIPTVINPLNSRQARKDCEGVARRAFVDLGNKVGFPFASTDKIKCVEIIEVKENNDTPPAASMQNN